MRFFARLVLAAATLFWFAALSARAGQPPTDSVYRLDVPLVDQDGKGQHLADRRGRPLVLGIFYTSSL
jgi:protein SCO1/2